MPLTSDLFKDNRQLQDCAVRDSAHIVADEPPKRRGVNNQGEHVALIHEALRLLLNSPNMGSEIATQTYGPLTAEVIRKFKADEDPPILNLALGQTTPDNIVGKQTIARLDEKLRRLRKQPEEDEDSGKKAASGPFTIVPFLEAAPFLISQQLDDRSEDDLDFTKRDPTVRTPNVLEKVGTARALPTRLLEAEMVVELSVGGQAGRDMAQLFFANNAVQEKLHANGSRLSTLIRNSNPFPPAHAKVKQQITDHLKKSIDERKKADYHELAASKGVIPPPMISFSMKDRRLKFSVGGLKGVELFLSNFVVSATPRFWSGTLTYHYLDHFGINDTDLILDRSGHGSGGQVAMWVLQHERHPGHFPFINRIVVVERVEVLRF